MDFGKNLLKKYGWKEGSGLGKNSDGITKPLRANLKFDKAGLGEDKSKEFNNYWWDRAFNEAARNIDISKDGENVRIGTKDKDSVEISTKPYSSKSLGKTPSQNGYKNFIKKSVLSGSRETHEESSSSEPEEPDLPKYKTLNYEELFEACGGLTAHKGARHGLTLSGKLSRIEQQEEELMAKFQQVQKYLSARNWPYAPLKKQKNRPTLEANAEPVNDKIVEEHLHTNEHHHPCKKKHKKDKKDDDELPVETEVRDLMIPKEKKKRKKETAEESAQTCISENELHSVKKEKFPKTSIRDDPPNKIRKKKKVKKFADKSTMI